MPQVRNNKKGYTLVEVVVASALLVVVIGITAAMIFSALGGFGRAAAMDEAKQLAQSAYNFCEARLRTAQRLGINESYAGASESVWVADNGRLMYRATGAAAAGVDVLGAGVYPGMGVQITTWVEDNHLLHLEVVALRDGEAVYTRESAFLLATMQRLDAPVEGHSEEQCNPVLTFTP